MIDILRTAQEAAVAVVLKQTEPHGLAGVPALAPARRRRRAGQRAGRGRARRAAGFTHHGDPDAAMAAILATLDR